MILCVQHGPGFGFARNNIRYTNVQDPIYNYLIIVYKCPLGLFSYAFKINAIFIPKTTFIPFELGMFLIFVMYEMRCYTLY